MRFYVAIIFMVTFLQAQEWVQRFEGEDFSGTGYPIYEIQKTNDGGFILCAGVGDNRAIKLNQTGDLEWSYTFAGGFPKYIEQSDDGEIFVPNVSDVIILNETGEQIGSFGISVPGPIFDGKIIDNNSFLGLYTNVATTSKLLFSNTNGGVIWEKDYEAVYRGIDQSFNGTYFLTGFNAFDSTSFMKIDSDGNTIWNKKYYLDENQLEMYDGISTSDSSFISIGVHYTDGTAETGADLVVIKLDDNGDSLWTKRYGGQYHDYSETIIETFNGNYLIAGYKTQAYDQGDTDAWLLLIDSNGDSLWSKTYSEIDGQGVDKAYSVVQVEDGSFVFCGLFNDAAFVAKTEYAEEIILSTEDNFIIQDYMLHQNYPNPFNPTTKISYDLPEASVVRLSIYDLMGREIRTMINSKQTAGFKNIQWNATDNLGKSVPAGMYIYTIEAGQFRQTRKMVLLK